MGKRGCGTAACPERGSVRAEGFFLAWGLVMHGAGHLTAMGEGHAMTHGEPTSAGCRLGRCRSGTIDICAPGEAILSTTFNGDYGLMWGTSMASAASATHPWLLCTPISLPH